MKSIAIVTINDNTNYGNRLQNYAVQEYFKNLNFYTETLVVKRNIKKNKSLKKFFNMNLSDIFYRLENLYKSKINRQKITNRNNMIYDFTKEYINESTKIYNDSCFDQGTSDSFDYFFTGSDQVWNPNYIGDGNSFFLKGIMDHKKNSFSASFGLSNIDQNYNERYKEYLSTFNTISVRETNAKRIISDLLPQKNVKVLLDPTMLISIDKWVSKFKSIRKFDEPYILIYNLGAISYKNKRKIKKIAKDNSYTIINLMDYKNEYYESDPIDFVELIYNSKLVITDSFHGTVFSILMKVPFITSERVTINSLSSRIDSLLNTFKLSNRKFDNIGNIDLFWIDWSATDQILETQKKKAKEYFEEIFDNSIK